MTVRKKRWLIGIGTFLLVLIIAGYIAGRILIKRFEPMVREQAIQYLSKRFNSQVELTSLRIHLPKMSAFAALLHRDGAAKIDVDGEGLSMRFGGAQDLPP